MKPTPTEITECTDEKVLCEWLGYALGWKIVDIKGKPHWDKGTEITPKSKWQPTSPTEKGKAQCWDLMEQFRITVYGKINMVAGDSATVHYGEFTSTKTRQIAVVKAALLCAIGD